MNLLVLTCLAMLTSCEPERKEVYLCPQWVAAKSPTNIFDVRSDTSLVDSTSPPQLTYAQRGIMLHNAYKINRWLDAKTARDSSYVNAYFYAKCERLNRNPHAPCHILVHADMDGFEGLFLVIKSPSRGYKSLYVAGIDGGASGQSGMFHDAPVSVGRMLNDSLLEVKKGSTFLAFRASGEKNSYTDTTINKYLINYRTANFTLLDCHTYRTPLTTYFD